MHSVNTSILEICIASLTLLVANTALAGDTGSVATMDEPTHLMSLTVSASDLFQYSSAAGFQPFIGVTVEFKADEDWGFAVRGGGGSTSAKSGLVGSQDFTAWEAGGQLRYYVLGGFDHGMQIGGELLYVNVLRDTEDTVSGNDSRITDALGIGPFVGYKLATKVGFTFDAQLGIQRTFALAEAEPISGETDATTDAHDWDPLLNLNVGWSF